MLGWLLLDSWLLLWLFRVGRWIRLLPLDLEGLLVVDIRDGLLKLLVFACATGRRHASLASRLKATKVHKFVDGFS